MNVPSRQPAARKKFFGDRFGPATATSGQRVSRPDPERAVSRDE